MTEEKTKYGKEPTYRETADALLGDPSISNWLKEAVKALEQRDPLDAQADAAILLKLQSIRNSEIFKQSEKTEA